MPIVFQRVMNWICYLALRPVFSLFLFCFASHSALRAHTLGKQTESNPLFGTVDCTCVGMLKIWGALIFGSLKGGWGCLMSPSCLEFRVNHFDGSVSTVKC